MKKLKKRKEIFNEFKKKWEKETIDKKVEILLNMINTCFEEIAKIKARKG